MSDTSVTKVQSTRSPRGKMGQKYLASGVQVAMRLWIRNLPGDPAPCGRRDYETVGLCDRRFRRAGDRGSDDPLEAEIPGWCKGGLPLLQDSESLHGRGSDLSPLFAHEEMSHRLDQKMAR